MNKENLIKLAGYFLYLVFFISIFFSFRAISSFALGSLLIWAIAEGKLRIKRNTSAIYIIACTVYFALGIFSNYRFASEEDKGHHVLLQAGILLTGLAIYLSSISKKMDGDIVFLLLAGCLGLVLLYCLAVNLMEFFKTKDTGLFYYHSLVRPAKQHAVYFSVYVFSVLVWFIESVRRNSLLFNRWIYFAGIIFFSIALFFLSSKLVLGFYLLYLLGQLIFSLNPRKNLKLSVLLLVGLLVGAGLAMFTKNPVGNRFRELLRGDIALVNQGKYDPATYFNGLQFRLLQWRLVPEILDDNRAWMSGVGPVKAQELLDSKYRERNMYIGEPQTNDRGYLGYNAHNQFLEALLQNGIIGTIVFLVISVLLLKMGWERRRTGFAIFFVLLFIYFFMESVFETQHGIILLSFLPVFLYNREETF